MARGRRATVVTIEAPPSVGDNSKPRNSGLSDATIQKHIRLVQSAKEEADAAHSGYLNALKAAQVDGCKLKILKSTLVDKKRDARDVIADEHDRIRYLALVNIPTRPQDLFDDLPADFAGSMQPDTAAAAEARIWEADDQGYGAGKTGLRPIHDHGYAEGTEEAVAFRAGWTRGQAKLAGDAFGDGSDVSQPEPGAELDAEVDLGEVGDVADEDLEGG